MRDKVDIDICAKLFALRIILDKVFFLLPGAQCL